MHSSSTFYSSKAVFLSTPHPDSDIHSSFYLRRRSMKTWDLGVHLGSFNCYHQLYSSSNSTVPSTPNQYLRNGFLYNIEKFSFCGRKNSSLTRSFAPASALEQEPIACENDSFVSLDAGESNEAAVINESEGKKVASVEEVDQIYSSNLLKKERVDIRGLTAILVDAKTADDVEELLKDYKNLPLPAYSSIIKAFGIDKKLDAAFALVESLKRNSKDNDGSVGPNLYIYNSLLGAVKEAGQFDKVGEVIEDMKAHGVVPNIVTYNTLISVHVKQGQPGEAFSVLDDIEKNGLSPSPVTYSNVLLAYREMNDANGAIDFFVKLREEYRRGTIGKDTDYDWEGEFVKLENFTIRICYLIMRQFLVKEADPSTNIFKILSDMGKENIKPGRAVYEKLVWACTRESHYTVATGLYRRLREMESGISLSVCNHVIWLMGKSKKWWAALEVYEELLDKGPKPNNLSYELIISHFNFLLNAASKKGIWKWGVRLIDKMIDKGLKPRAQDWNAVLLACSKASEPSAAVQIFRRMVEQGEKPTVISYVALLSALEKGNLYDEVLRVWEHMCKMGVKPNLYAYTILVSVYIGQGQFEMVDSVLQEMTKSRIEPSVVTFNAIITGCAKMEMGGAALEWFQRMKFQNAKPNEITYEMLIEALARDGKPRLAYEMYLKAQNEGLRLSSKAYDFVIRTCQASNTSLDTTLLGPRPQEKKKTLKIRKNLSEFRKLAELPRQGRDFDRTDIYPKQIQGR